MEIKIGINHLEHNPFSVKFPLSGDAVLKPVEVFFNKELPHFFKKTSDTLEYINSLAPVIEKIDSYFKKTGHEIRISAYMNYEPATQKLLPVVAVKPPKEYVFGYTEKFHGDEKIWKPAEISSELILLSTELEFIIVNSFNPPESMKKGYFLKHLDI